MSIAPARPDALLKDAETVVAFPLRRSDSRASVISEGDMLRWRYGERLEDVIAEACRRHADRVAVSLDGLDITFAELDARANQMARMFRELGVKPGDRVAALLDRGLDCYVTLLGLLKARATYVPIDANHPADRLAYILEDSNALLAVTHQRFADRFPADLPVVVLDRARYQIEQQPNDPLDDERAPAADQLCYILYTSGTTGRPKGVAVAHPSICNFVRVAAESYGFGVGDRVYQGMSIAFDFSVEELWVPLVAGATLVPNASANSLFGEELAEFLESRAVTCFCCVPTLLASIERDLPNLRVLLIGGEACPPALVKRWSRPGRSLLNSYGPTEATVTATLGHMAPDKPVTIGRPLPTYSIVILDAERPQALPMGEAGEIGIAGIGRIGQAVARRAAAFDCEIGYFARHQHADLPYAFKPDLAELAAWCDILFVTLAGGPSTKGIVSAEVLEALGPDGYLINISRGSTVDEPALLEALENRTIKGAGLDVFLNEPGIDPRFLALDNTVLHPHHGSGTVETRRAMGQLVRDNLAAHFAGQPLLTPVA